MAKAFQNIPKRLILKRLLAPSIGVYLVGFLLTGVLASSQALHDRIERHIPIAPIPFSVTGTPGDAARQIQRLAFHYVDRIPEVCSQGAVNEFQRSQCSAFWERLTTVVAVASLPIVLVLLFILFSLDFVSLRYRRARRAMDSGKARSIGVVTDPPTAPGDFFSWALGLQVVTVEVQEGKAKGQIRVCLPWDAPVPIPGQKLAVFDWGNAFGAKRYAGMLYAPHMAVVQGS